MIIASFSFAALLVAFWLTGAYFGVSIRTWPVAVSIALLLAPYWFFGFGIAQPLRRRLRLPLARVAAAGLLILPYLIFSLPSRTFRPLFCGALLLTLLAITTFLEFAKGTWADYAVLLILAIIVEKHLFDAAWPIPGLTGLTKLLFVNLVLYNYLVVRPRLTFDWRAKISDFIIGLREFAFYVPFALALGFALGFLHLHRTAGSIQQFAASWIFTLFFVAVPEEIFFRGLLLTLFEKSMGTRIALTASAVIFGLAHFNKRAVFNWRYIILAAVAGIFYGRSYLAKRRILGAGVTHATVDTVWSIWLR